MATAFQIREADVDVGSMTPHGQITGVDGGWVMLGESDNLWWWSLNPDSDMVTMKMTPFRV